MVKDRYNVTWLTVAPSLPFKYLSKAASGSIVAPFYHAVSNQPLPHIRHLYAVKTVLEFERDLEFLLKHFSPIDFHDLPTFLDKKQKSSGKPPMLLSFDDGLREFFDPIAPILLRKGIPAICFLNSAFLDNADLFFRYKASLLLEAMPDKNDLALRRKILSVAYADRDQLDTLATDFEVNFKDFLQHQKPYLTSTQVESLLKQGFHIGAHSVDHPEYRFLNLDEQLRQTTKSVEVISNKFGLGYRLFSFPFTDFGVSRKFFDFVLEEKKVADFSFGTAGLKTDIHPRHIQRIPMEINNMSAENILRCEFLYFWMRMPFGKNSIHRT